MITSCSKGNQIYYEDSAGWHYVFNNEPISNIDCLVCPRCQKISGVNEPDICLGHIPGIKSACCGHGVEEGFKIVHQE